ncbi:MAG: hypothetical protein Q8R92_01990, partial [Deltaproteobacteria bacterium]|nr:hypothetical protein [Deltaproteobacteria bacterium]
MRGSRRARRRRESEEPGPVGAGEPTPEEIRRVVEPVVEELGLELLDLKYGRGRTSALLRLVLDHPEAAVTVEACSRVSGAVGRLLDGL